MAVKEPAGIFGLESERIVLVSKSLQRLVVSAQAGKAVLVR